MPCNSDYMDATVREEQSILTAQLICYLFPLIGLKVDDEIKTASKARYGDISILDSMVVLLCSTVSSLSDEQMSKYVYDGRNPMARKLADWYDIHIEADMKRKSKENIKRLNGDIKKIVSRLSEHQLEELYKYLQDNF